jgi:hypothetical protein
MARQLDGGIARQLWRGRLGSQGGSDAIEDWRRVGHTVLWVDGCLAAIGRCWVRLFRTADEEMLL